MKKTFNFKTIALWIMLVFSMVAVNCSYSDAFYETRKDNGTIADRKLHEDLMSSRSLSSLTAGNGYMWPDVLSSNATEIEDIYFSLRDDSYESLTGIKVNRIDMVQNGKTIFSSNAIDSYSVQGEYRTNASTQILNPFANQDGDNIVDIIFYLHDKEVARIEDYNVKVYSDVVVSDIWPTEGGISSTTIPNELTILNADANDDIDIWLEDENGDRITETEEVCDSWYDTYSHELFVQSKLLFNSSSYLDDYPTYNFHVSVNGEEIPIIGDYCSEYFISSDPWCYWFMNPEESGRLKYEVAGINLLDNGPYRVEVEQDGIITGSVDNIDAYIDEYGYEVVAADITSVIETPGAPYITYLYDANDELIDEYYWSFELDAEIDIIDPVNPDEETNPDEELLNLDKALYKEFVPTQPVVNTDKDWTVTFNKGIDLDTVSTANIYVLDRNTGEQVESGSFEFDSTSVKIVHPSAGYISGHKYYLIIDGVTSDEGTGLVKPVLMEFEVE